MTDPAPRAAVSDTWGEALWGSGQWGARPYWAADWDWWYQCGTQRLFGLADMIVEARWDTDAYTPGDGTFRGDLQPGKLELHMIRRDNRFDNYRKTCTIWACYVPTGATWCWYVDTVSHRLVAAGDPSGVDIVVSGLTWPARLTTGSYAGTRPAETVAARLGAIVSRFVTDGGLYLPTFSGAVVNDRHLLPAQTDPYFPWLQMIRNAASNGVAWLNPFRAADGSGQVVLAYDYWQTVQIRTLAQVQILSGSVTTDGTDDMITKVSWTGVDPAGASTNLDQYGAGYGSYGILPVGPMRVAGQIAAGGLDLAAVTATGNQILVDRGDPNERYLSQLDLSGPGDRRAANGTITKWDPATMIWRPTDVVDTGLAGYPKCRVVSSSHRLTLRAWETTLNLAKYTAPTALPVGPGLVTQREAA